MLLNKDEPISKHMGVKKRKISTLIHHVNINLNIIRALVEEETTYFKYYTLHQQEPVEATA